jgi:hypothetical protein
MFQRSKKAPSVRELKSPPRRHRLARISDGRKLADFEGSTVPYVSRKDGLREYVASKKRPLKTGQVEYPPAVELFLERLRNALRQRNDLHDRGLIFCSGFRGAARRLREPGGASLYYTRNSPDASIAAFETALFSIRDVPTFFWGDLDYSGMAILASLRSSFPQAQAWQPGYEPMLTRLVSKDGHSPAESGKERQRPVDRTGCTYADETLIPALRAHGCFVDQE